MKLNIINIFHLHFLHESIAAPIILHLFTFKFPGIRRHIEF